MAATIAAKPNPVTFYLNTLGTQMNTTITWNTGFTAFAQVFLSRNGGDETLFDDEGSPQFGGFSGSKQAAVNPGDTLEFRLRQLNASKTLLASVTVRTRVLVPEPIDDITKFFRQGIFNVEVNPGVDSVAMSFRTRQPTNPFVEVINQDTGEIAGLWLRPEEKKVHSMVFGGLGGHLGYDKSMAQDTLHSFRIVAHALPDSFGPEKVERSGFFRTGSRTATFFFDRIHVRNDGDPGLKGAGEFRFDFGGGDADTGWSLGNEEHYGEQDKPAEIKAGDDVDVNKVVTIPAAPRLLWAQVAAIEYDTSFFAHIPSGVLVIGAGTSFKPEGSSGQELDDRAWADVTKYFDISEMLEEMPADIPFAMSTSEFAIAYSVAGRLRVEAHPGSPPVDRTAKVVLENNPPFSSVVIKHSHSAMFPGQEGHAHRVVLSPDGAVYHQALLADLRASGNGRWTKLGGRFEGPLTMVAAQPDRLSLFGLSPEGAVLYKSHTPDTRPDSNWQTLGGAFVGPVTAAAAEDGEVELFAKSEEGSVFHRTLAHPQRRQTPREWEHLGEGIEGPIAALLSPRSGLSLFALGRGGEVLHKRRLPRDPHKHRSLKEEWRPAGREWETLGVASEGLLSAQWAGDESLLVSVIAEDETIRILTWPAYPESLPPEGWQVIGTINEVLEGRISKGEEPTVLDGAKGAEDGDQQSKLGSSSQTREKGNSPRN